MGTGLFPSQPIEIPMSELSDVALERVIDDFITRDGSNDGEEEFTLEKKRSVAIEQLLDGDVVIVFDPASATTTLLDPRALPSDRGW